MEELTRRIALLLALVVVMSVMSTSVGSAAPGGAADPAGASARPDDWRPEEGDLRPRTRPTKQGELSVSASMPSPSACRGKSNDPHVSTSPATLGDIKGYAMTYCSKNVPYLEVKSTVWRKRWWGYERVGKDGFGTVEFHYTIGRSGIYDGCQNNTWRTVGYHVARDFDLQYYTGETQNYLDVLC